MAEWKILEPAELLAIRKSQQKQLDDAGVQFETSLSPYDLPEAVRGSLDESTHTFVIEFKYIQPEDWVRMSGPGHLTFRFGKNSNRLYGLEVDVKLPEANEVAPRIAVERAVEQALQALKQVQLAPRANVERSAGNYDAVASVVHQKPEIFGDLAA